MRYLRRKRIVFEPGSAVIAPEAKETIDKLADILKDCADYPIEGRRPHRQPGPRGDESLALRTAGPRGDRGAAIAPDLTGNLSAHGYGESEPVMANDTEENREKNRRIEFRLLTPPAGTDGAAATDAAAVEVRTPDKDHHSPPQTARGPGRELRAGEGHQWAAQSLSSA